MLRPMNCLGLSGVLLACLLTGASPAVLSPAETGNHAIPAKGMRAKLSRPISLEKGFPESTSLREVVEFISDRYDVLILVNEARFQEVNGEAVNEARVKLPRMMNTELGTILQLVLAQIHAGYLLHSNYVEMVPLVCAYPKAWKQRRDLAPVVLADLTGRPLEEALRELADTSGINVVLDARAGGKAKTIVTASLNNVPIDTAVLILADMVDLRPVALDNVLYVTSKENAEQLLAWQEKQAEIAMEQE